MTRLTKLLLLTALVACSGDDPSLLVDLRTDLVPGIEFDSVTVELLGDDFDVSQTHDVSPTGDYLRGVRVGAFENLSSSRRTARARLFDRDGRRIGEREVTIEINGDTVVTIVFTRSCLAVTCPGDGDASRTACHNGMCVEPECSPENPDACGETNCTDASDCPAPTADCAEAVCLAGFMLLT